MSFKELENYVKEIENSVLNVVDQVDSMSSELECAIEEEKQRQEELHKAEMKAASTELYMKGWNAAIAQVRKAMAAPANRFWKGEEYDGKDNEGDGNNA